MIAWEIDDRTLHLRDGDTTGLAVHGVDLVAEEATPAMSRPVEETLVVATADLQFPHAAVSVCSRDSSEHHDLGSGDTPLSLPPDEYLVTINAAVETSLQFSGAVRIEHTDDGEAIRVSFPDRTRVTVGFRRHHDLPADTITVPDSPDGVAAAITQLAGAHETASPDRSDPALRGHPALLERGETLEVPDKLQAARSDSGIELVVSPTYESLFVAAPLAYYLQATLRTADSSVRSGGPRLRLPDLGIEKRLSPMPDLEYDVDRLLRKTVFLDCLVRNAGPYSVDLAEQRIFETLDLDAGALYDASPQQRLATYLDVAYEAIEHRLPDWHLSTYVTPDYDSVELLPFLLDRLSMISMPRTSTLEGQELIERSLEDFYRGGGEPATHGSARASAGNVAAVDIVKPDLRNGRAHGWHADGVPIDVFKTTPEAYYNRLEYLERSSESMSVCVVLNDPEMAGEYNDVAEIYRQRAEEVAMDVIVEESLSTAELARVFERESEFVHYIGHCEHEGLRCPDGSLSTASLSQCNAQTFFLNACGSYHEGTRLIEKGSVAGGVTVRKVLNDHAIKVGSTFAQLLINGFSIERALDLARSRIMMGKDYAVVGDGTHSLSQRDQRLPVTITIEELTDGPDEYLVTLDCYSTRTTGSYYVPRIDTNDLAYLCGTDSSFTLGESGVGSLLRETDASVIYDGDLYWSKTLAPQFET
ncbi:hypothetical protein [Natronorubrum thiooxidans]|uniref:CHAT domain-containing protein n=1 Tax=Natronorubrum thiooxidans TaxID=308853 RepID=A0A1N7EK95_9EURY|nr:hypothetical protein [Natronorubrum thiooxidans]SIR88516.1 hypothetical protein SAMN05421752_104188 [Natronorubrum thiooxidans]